ncbi:MAG: aryl-sulfate sulfotransferase, partial [Candidatus Hodarchaeota archaeon]
MVKILLNRTMNHNGVAWVLLLITVLLASPTSVAPYLSTPFTNQLETSIFPSASQRLNPQGNQLREAIVIEPARSVGYMASMGMKGVEPNITSTDSAFDGYNLFILGQQTKTDPPKKDYKLLVTNMEGEMISDKEMISLPQDVWFHSAKFINSTTLLYGTGKGAAFWNIYDQSIVNLGFESHHEYVYNPLNNTIFTHEGNNVKIDGTDYRFDVIKEYDTSGQLVWSLDSRSFLSHTQWCPYQDLVGGYGIPDITHSNSLFFDPDEDVFYYHPRNVNTFYKIDHKTGQVLWGLGEYGNFTLFDRHGNQRQTLFYHAHSLEKVDEDTFILFDNDKHNQTNPMNHRSRIMEITINETTMTAHESWSWTAPPDYYSAIYGDADRLPNGNRLGTFGTYQHPP